MASTTQPSPGKAVKARSSPGMAVTAQPSPSKAITTQSNTTKLPSDPSTMASNHPQTAVTEGGGECEAASAPLTLPKDADGWDNETRWLLKKNKALSNALEEYQLGTKPHDQKLGQLEVAHKAIDKQHGTASTVNRERVPEIAPILQKAYEKIEEYLANQKRHDAIRMLHAAQRNNEKVLRIKILRHTTRECQELATRLRTKVPLEIRDQIYLYVVKDKEEMVTEEVKSFFIKGSGITTNYRHKFAINVKACLDPKFLPLCVKSEYVGRIIAEEASEVFYKWRTSGLYRYCGGDLPVTLARDHLSLKIDPTHFLRTLTVVVAGWTEKNHQGKPVLSLRNVSTGHALSPVFLEPLRQLELKNGFRLYIEVMPKYSLSPQAIDKRMVVSRLQPLYDELTAAGMIVEILT